MKNCILKIFSVIIFASLFTSCSIEDDPSFIEGLPDAVVNNDPPGSPARGLTETWDGHNDTLYRQYFDQYVGVYYDDAVERPLEWPYQFTSDIWEHVTEIYGSFGDDAPLYAVFHGKPGDNSFYTIFDDVSLNRSLIDISFEGFEMSTANMDAVISEVGNIVESSSNNTKGAPASKLWEDQWTGIFLYDVYKSIGMEEEAQRVYDAYIKATIDSPSPDTNWFEDWYFPIYEEYGAMALNNFFKLTSENLPKENNVYTRDMTLGELVHFYSGATGEDLQPLAEGAFGWSEERETQLLQARADYPLLDYPFDPITIVTDLTFDAQVTVKYENSDGPSGAESSLKVIDNDINTKYLFSGFASDAWIQQEFTEEKIVSRYTLTSGNDAPGRDPVSWELVGSNDKNNWVVLDTRANESFPDRNQTREFTTDNEEAYLYYRLNITENGGASLFQLSEWRLLNYSSLLD